jgi:multiple sugar transport system permease protein
MTLARRDVGLKMMVFVMLIIISVTTIMPFIWMVLTGFKTEVEALRIPMQFFPDNILWGNYAEIFERFNFLTYFWNTVRVAFFVTMPQIFLSALAAYAFARLEFPGKNIIFVSLMAALMVPMQLILVPRFLLMMQFGWIDTLTGVIVPSIPSIFATFFFRQHIMTIPKELDESAYMDGCTHPRIFISIILPLCKSTAAAMAILSVTFAWNTLLWPLIVLNSMSNFTLPLGINIFRGQFGSAYNLMMAGATVSVLPILIVFITCQRYFLEGIASTGIKA